MKKAGQNYNSKIYITKARTDEKEELQNPIENDRLKESPEK